MYRDHRYRKSKTGRTWEPEYLRFPGSRDRVIIHRLLISSWSDKLFVIEAGRGSGALITAECSRKYGREVEILGK